MHITFTSYRTKIFIFIYFLLQFHHADWWLLKVVLSYKANFKWKSIRSKIIAQKMSFNSHLFSLFPFIVCTLDWISFCLFDFINWKLLLALLLYNANLNSNMIQWVSERKVLNFYPISEFGSDEIMYLLFVVVHLHMFFHVCFSLINLKSIFFVILTVFFSFSSTLL